MEGTCPLCRRSGVISPLYNVSNAFGAVTNLCSNISCPYPLDSYDGLLDSLSQAPPINPLQSSHEAQHEADAPPGVNVIMLEPRQSENSSIISQNARSCEQSPPKVNVNPNPLILRPQVSKPCAILPRYLADSLREGRWLWMDCWSTCFRTTFDRRVFLLFQPIPNLVDLPAVRAVIVEFRRLLGHPISVIKKY